MIFASRGLNKNWRNRFALFPILIGEDEQTGKRTWVWMGWYQIRYLDTWHTSYELRLDENSPAYGWSYSWP